jgi:hypothetical protein
MPGAVRISLYVGVFLGLAYIGFVLWRRREIKGSEISEALGLAITPFPIPGAVKMVYRAMASKPLPVFNNVENRVALVFGGSFLIVSFLYGLYAAVQRAARN